LPHPRYCVDEDAKTALDNDKRPDKTALMLQSSDDRFRPGRTVKFQEKVDSKKEVW